MQKVIVEAFGGVERLHLAALPDPCPTGQQVLVRLTSIGMNHADLMARRGEYRLSSGEPPFTPGLEGGGYIEAVGPAVHDRHVGQRVLLSLDAPVHPEGRVGTYGTHYLTSAAQTVIAPDALPDQLLGALWLAYLTAWSCLIWRQGLRAGQVVLLPAASSSVAIAAAQIVRHHGGVAIGTTTSALKCEKLQAMGESAYAQIVCTGERQWRKQVKKLTDNRGVDVVFDPVGAGPLLQSAIHLLAEGGTIWIYGLLGKPDVLDVTPLIRKRAALRGWLLDELSALGSEPVQRAYQHVLDRFADGTYALPIAGIFPLRDVREAHARMERGAHIGKFILVP
ncbi:zinc-dependent alcohol dehydrogenase family protein [Gloeobacter violaceus]|uniref:Gll1949 protein n=1 Tax=Gloeobacter violaceus (strain ATCC 29082 / PCC 7421) TaxID=251221 RepID=Q7NJ83_GLOVI|nr:zinc-dependent alcohol dehydrogenase family protein [Gloeobacter violaceus]BAC89890.1 gll1949 [Gloeobacter violaceus PCC 7421]